MMRSGVLSLLCACALLPVFPAAGGSLVSAEELATSLRQKADELTTPDATQSKRAKVLKALAARIMQMEQGKLEIDATGKDGTSTLMLAVAMGEHDAVAYLLKQGADRKKKNARGNDALSLAKDDAMRALLRGDEDGGEAIPQPEPAPAEEEPTPQPEPAPAEEALTSSRHPGDGKGAILSWEEADSYLHALIARKEGGLDFVLDAEGNSCCMGRLEENWNTLRDQQSTDALFSFAGSLFGTHHASPLITFLLSQSGTAQPKEPLEWYYSTQRAYLCGTISDDERNLQLAHTRPYLTHAELAEKGGLRHLRMCASAGDTELIRTLLQQGVDPVVPEAHSGDTDIRAEAERIPTLCRGELQGVCVLPVASAVMGGWAESAELLLQANACEENLDKLLACACLTRRDADFDALEKLLLARGARHSDLSLACAAAARSDETVERLLTELLPAARAQLTRALLVMVTHGVGLQKGNRCKLAEKLVEAGADIHALERIPGGMSHHPLYALFSSNGSEAIQLYATLASLGMNEKKIFDLPMTPDGDTLLDVCDPSQQAFLNWNIGPRIVIDAGSQKLTLEGGVAPFSADVSTGAAGLGESHGSGQTPIGRFSIYSSHGENAPLMTMFRMRRPVGTWPEAANPGEDAILSRILTLQGEERSNANTRARNIYIHGTADVEHLGQPASHGCIRLSPEDMVQLFDMVYPGMEVLIVPPGGNTTRATEAKR